MPASFLHVHLTHAMFKLKKCNSGHIGHSTSPTDYVSNTPLQRMPHPLIPRMPADRTLVPTVAATATRGVTVVLCPPFKAFVHISDAVACPFSAAIEQHRSCC